MSRDFIALLSIQKSALQQHPTPRWLTFRIR